MNTGKNKKNAHMSSRNQLMVYQNIMNNSVPSAFKLSEKESRKCSGNKK
jgi:hypothetical protein